MTRRTKTKPVAAKKLPTSKHRRSNSAAQKKNADNLLTAMFDEANKFGLDNLRSARNRVARLRLPGRCCTILVMTDIYVWLAVHATQR